MILLIDNYDSFSYNLYQLIGTINPDVTVMRNDKITLSEIANIAPTHIVLSPGPGKPQDAGICEDVIRKFAGKIPIFGVCLGHQAICEVYGLSVTYAAELMHGKESEITLDTESALFLGLKNRIMAARYHSLAADPHTLSNAGGALKVIAETAAGKEIMAVQHTQYAVFGVQFHPESILTPDGKIIVENFLAIQ
ncbi:MAG: hypothetical protein Ta2A_22680 [Treponemataceae bacterium]|nr:MAG: hypothetical protein Ta2A_22680 [Treponemataceae bacterium]